MSEYSYTFQGGTEPDAVLGWVSAFAEVYIQHWLLHKNGIPGKIIPASALQSCCTQNELQTKIGHSPRACSLLGTSLSIDRNYPHPF